MSSARTISQHDPAALFSGVADISVTVLRAEETLPPLFAAERDLLRPMVPSRKREFAWGRAAARAALATLGRDDSAILPDADRVPVWPDGIAGSITHSGPFCGAAVTRNCVLVGFDIETTPTLDPDLWPDLFTDTEILCFVAQHQRAVAYFSAKESVFKAHFPRHRQMFGFRDLEIELNDDGSFCAAFTRLNGPAFGPVNGRWQQTADYTASGVVIHTPSAQWH